MSRITSSHSIRTRSKNFVELPTKYLGGFNKKNHVWTSFNDHTLPTQLADFEDLRIALILGNDLGVGRPKNAHGSRPTEPKDKKYLTYVFF